MARICARWRRYLAKTLPSSVSDPGTSMGPMPPPLKAIPPHITDEPMIAGLKKIGIEPGTSFDLEKADAAIRKALKSAPEEAQQLMSWKLPTLARVVNGWSMNTDTMGVYGLHPVPKTPS